MKQSEIWLIDFDFVKSEALRKKRPVIIINDDALTKLPLKIIVPLTDWKDSYNIAPWIIRIKPNENNGLRQEYGIDCFQIRSLSAEKLIKKIGDIEDDILREIKIALRRVLDL